MTHLTQAHQYSPLGSLRFATKADADRHKKRVLSELAAAGSSWYSRLSMEARHLPRLIHPSEHIMAAMHGYDEDGSGMLIATDRRIIYLDKKPLFIHSEELTYDIVGGVSYGYAGLFTTVTLHTRVADFTLRLVSLRCARRFIDFIEKRCLENTGSNSSDVLW